MSTQGIRLENVSITARTGLVCMDAQDILLKNVEILNQEGPAFHFFNAQRVTADGLAYREQTAPPVRVQGPRNEDLTLSTLKPDDVSLVDGASDASLRFE
jgi:hypothetical protein